MAPEGQLRAGQPGATVPHRAARPVDAGAKAEGLRRKGQEPQPPPGERNGGNRRHPALAGPLGQRGSPQGVVHALKGQGKP